MTAPSDARAYTLLPHWAHAVAHLGKRIENRNNPIPPHLVGQRVAIHAGATLPRGWGGDVHAFPGTFTPDYCTAPNDPVWRSRIVHWKGDGFVSARPIATRAIVATAVLRPHDPDVSEWHRQRYEHTRPSLGDAARDWPPLPEWADPHAEHWWALHDVITLAEPVPVARGQPGLWRLDAETIEAVDAAGGWP